MMIKANKGSVVLEELMLAYNSRVKPGPVHCSRNDYSVEVDCGFSVSLTVKLRSDKSTES